MLGLGRWGRVGVAKCVRRWAGDKWWEEEILWEKREQIAVFAWACDGNDEK